MGLLYLPMIGIRSGLGCAFDGIGHDHDNEWYEIWAKWMADDYYKQIGDTGAINNHRKHNPMSHTEEWYDYYTLYLYAVMLAMLII